MASCRDSLVPLQDDDDGTDNEEVYLLPGPSRSMMRIASSDHSLLKTFRRVLKEKRIRYGVIKVLVTGRTGMGKSTLVNSIIEKGKMVAKEGSGGGAVTSKVKTHSFCVTDDVMVSLIDSPGLRHSDQNNRHFFENLFEDMMIQGDNTSIVLYCKKITDHRLTEDEIAAIKQLYHTFGPEFWKRVVIVLTFANEVVLDYVEEGDPSLDDVSAWDELIEKRFISLLEKHRQELKTVLREKILIPDSIVNEIQFIPAGNYKVSRTCRNSYHLPDRENWLYELLKLCAISNNADTTSLSTICLRENLHLAVIIDNEGTPSNRESLPNGDYEETELHTTVKLNPRAKVLKKYFHDQGQLVFAFNSLNVQSINLLLKILTTTIVSAEVAAFTLIVLCKEKGCEEIQLQDIIDHVSHLFAKVPKIFFAHFTKPKNQIILPEKSTLPKKSLAFIIVSPTVSQSSDDDLQVIRIFQETVEASFGKPVTECYRDMKTKILRLEGRPRCRYEETFGQSSCALPSIYIPSTSKGKHEFFKKKLDIQRVLWRRVRSITMDELFENKDEIRTLLRNERIARLSTGVAGMVIGGGLVVGGIAAAPFTFGASIGLSVAGGVVGAVAGMGGISALITRKVMANNHLKKAQQQVTFDQQLSNNVNETVFEYYGAIKRHNVADISGGVGTGLASTLATGSRIGMAAFIGVEPVLETGAVVLSAAGRGAGMIVAGVSLGVTVPVDIAFIAYHSYRIHQARQDESGTKESDPFVKWFLMQIENLLLDTFTLDKQEYKVDNKLSIPHVGFNMHAPVPEYTITIRTLISGPFILPKGATLVSAVYDVNISNGRKLEQPISIDIEHCIDVEASDKTADSVSFAIGTLDFATKAYTFKLLKGGSIEQNEGTISVTESSILCMVYTEARGETSKPLKYAAIWGYEKLYRNSWSLRVFFTKYLQTHLGFIQREFPIYTDSLESHPFTITPLYTGIPLEQFRQMSVQNEGWLIVPTMIPEGQQEISKIQINTIDIQSKLTDSPVTKVPFIDICVQVCDQKAAKEELKYAIHLEGTELVIPIERKKEIKQNN